MAVVGMLSGIQEERGAPMTSITLHLTRIRHGLVQLPVEFTTYILIKRLGRQTTTDSRFTMSVTMFCGADTMAAGIDTETFAPPSNSTDYARKPLPALPPRDRRSVASSFSSEVSHAFAIPRVPREGSPLIFDWEREGSGKSVRLSQQALFEDVSALKLRPRKVPVPAIRMTMAPTTTTTTQQAACPPAPLPGATPSLLGTERRILPNMADFDAMPASAFYQTLPTIDTYQLKAHPVPSHEILSPQPKSSVQKILQLTGNMSPNTSVSQDAPSLHNSTQKIRQLTGLDIGLRKLHPVAEEASGAGGGGSGSGGGGSGSGGSSSTYSAELEEVPEEEDASSYFEPADSVYSPSYAESVSELVTTPLTIPRYTQPASIPRHIPNALENESSVAAALRLSGFVAAGESLIPPEEAHPPPLASAHEPLIEEAGEEEEKEGEEIEEEAATETGEKEEDEVSQPSRRQSDARSLASSSSPESDDESITELEMELEPTTGELYHDSATYIAKSARIFSDSKNNSTTAATTSQPPAGGGKSSRRRSAARNSRTLVGHRRTGSSKTLEPSPTTTAAGAASSSRPFSLNSIFRKREPGLSERRANAPPHLDGVPGPGTTTTAPPLPSPLKSASLPPRRKPSYPPLLGGSSSTKAAAQQQQQGQQQGLDVPEDGQARFKVLSRIFVGGGSGSGGGGGAGGGSSTSDSTGKRDSILSTGSVGTAASIGGGRRMSTSTNNNNTFLVEQQMVVVPPRSAWSPDLDTPSDAGGSSPQGLLSRTLDHARQAAAGMRTRAGPERAEGGGRKDGLRAKIKVLRSTGQAGRASADDGAL